MATQDPTTATAKKLTVAVGGGTGHLGKYITKTLQDPKFDSAVGKLIILSRRSTPTPGSPEEELLKNPAVELRNISPVLSESGTDASPPNIFGDVDVYISAIGSSGHVAKDALAKQALSKESKVSLYIPSEFGVDHYVHDFDHVEWERKKAHFKLVQELLAKDESVRDRVTVCRIFIGLFAEDSVGPWFGFDTKNGKYESVGSPKVPIAFTSLNDVGKIVATVATQVPREKLPETLHVAGDSLSVSDLVATMEAAMPADNKSKIEVTEIDLAEYKNRVLNIDEPTRDPAPCLRFLMGEGKINHTSSGLGNDNELVNPGQKYFTWTKMASHAEEKQGRPWAEVQWPPANPTH